MQTDWDSDLVALKNPNFNCLIEIINQKHLLSNEKMMEKKYPELNSAAKQIILKPKDPSPIKVKFPPKRSNSETKLA